MDYPHRDGDALGGNDPSSPPDSLVEHGYRQQADDWQFNYPNLIEPNSRRLVNQNEWPPFAQNGDASRGFKKWWYHPMPRVPGHYKDAVNNNKLNNWWEYIMDFTRHPESL